MLQIAPFCSNAISFFLNLDFAQIRNCEFVKRVHGAFIINYFSKFHFETEGRYTLSTHNPPILRYLFSNYSACFPIEHFTILKPPNPSINVSEQQKIVQCSMKNVKCPVEVISLVF